MNIGWIKLDINILNDTKIKLIRKFPDGDKLLVLWLGLLCLAMKSDTSGYIYITEGIPYTPEDLSIEFDIEKKTVELGLGLFKKYNMIDMAEGGIIEVINFNKHQSLDGIEKVKEQNRIRQENYRKKQKLLLKSGSNVTDNVSNDTDKTRLDKIRKDNINKELETRFETVWRLYPKKLGKEKAFDKFKKQVKTDDDYKKIILSVENYAKHIRKENTEPQYIKHGSTFFNKDWKDWADFKANEKIPQQKKDLKPVFTDEQRKKESPEKIAEVKRLIKESLENTSMEEKDE